MVPEAGATHPSDAPRSSLNFENLNIRGMLVGLFSHITRGVRYVIRHIKSALSQTTTAPLGMPYLHDSTFPPAVDLLGFVRFREVEREPSVPVIGTAYFPASA